jgi:hypothetical protein
LHTGPVQNLLVLNADNQSVSQTSFPVKSAEQVLLPQIHICGGDAGGNLATDITNATVPILTSRDTVGLI